MLSKIFMISDIQTTIEKVVEKLKSYKPEKVILFGSMASGKVTENSDLDFFVIKETKKTLPERLEEIDGFFLKREIPLDFLVYTPLEVEKRLAMGDTFVADIMQNGKLLYAK